MSSDKPTTVRSARPEEAEAICGVQIRSIREIDGPDYGNDEALLERWCRNKKPEFIRSWLADPGNRTFVAVDPDDRIVGAALIHSSGEVRLCYVVPEVLGKGVGHALIERLTSEARGIG